MRVSGSDPHPSLGTWKNRGFHLPFSLIISLALLVALFEAQLHAQQQGAKLPRPRRLDEGIVWRRDPATGELNTTKRGSPATEEKDNAQPGVRPIRVTTQMVPVTCSVFGADGTVLRDLQRADFRVTDNGDGRPLVFFDAPSKEPASIALVIDASPSVLRDSEEMKQAARALIDGLSFSDELALVDFSMHTYLLLPFSRDRELLERAVTRVNVRQLLGDTGGSSIYEAVFLAAREVFAGRAARKAIVLLTDGQDSGLGLTLDPASASLQPGALRDRLTFDDVLRILATEDIQVFAISTENRPKIMTPEWLAAHNETTLITADARTWGIPPYTLYLAELTQRTGGQLYFLREAKTLADEFRQIAQRVGAEYWLGISPAPAATGAPRAGWHSLHVEVVGHSGATVMHRAQYYVPVQAH
jgi:VWFA-related protein